MSSLLLSQQIYEAGELYMLYAGIFNLVIGIIGNISLILVLTTSRTFKGNQCAFSLTVESISNTGLLLMIYLSRILTHILGYDPVLTSLSWCKIRIMISQIFGLFSLFTVCFLAVDQYLSTNLRQNWRQMSTLKLAYRFAFFNASFSALHSISFVIFTEIQPSLGCTVYNRIAKNYYSFFYYPVLSFFLPSIITIFSLLAYRNVRRIVRRQVPVVRRRLDRQMTAMVLARVICFFVLGFPFICVSLYELNMNTSIDNYMALAIVSLVSAIFYSLLYTNFAINFYMFLMVSPRFRRQVKNVLVKKCLCLMQCHRNRRPSKAQGNQICPVIAQPSMSIDDLD